MKKTILLLIIMHLFVHALSATSYAGEIFRLAPGVQNMAMGATGLSFAEGKAAGWWNPALLAKRNSNDVELMRAEHFGGLLKQNQLNGSFPRKRSIVAKQPFGRPWSHGVIPSKTLDEH